MTKQLCSLFVLLVSCISSFAIEGLKLSVQSTTNVVLTWPSNPGATYVVLYRQDLDTNTFWQTLAYAYQASTTTNVTSFVHEGAVCVPVAPESSIEGPGGPIVPGDSTSSTDSTPQQTTNGFVVPFPPMPPLPPYPSSLSSQSSALQSLNASETEGSSTEGATGIGSCGGFYQVLGVEIVSGLTNGMSASDFIHIAVRPEEGVKYLHLLVDGESFVGSELIQPPFTNAITFEYVDVMRLSNGLHTFQVEAAWADSDNHGLVAKALSAPFSIYVTNDIFHPNWDDWTGEELCSFDVQTVYTNATWEIEVYNIFDYIDWLNGQNPFIQPIHYTNGVVSAEGTIKYHWNMVDDDGYFRTNDYYDPIFISFTTITDNSSANISNPIAAASSIRRSVPNPLTTQGAKFPEQGHWVVAYQDMFRNGYDQNDRLKTALNSILGMADLPESGGAAAAPPFWMPPGVSTNQTWPLRYNYPKNHRLHNTNDVFQGQIIDDNFLLELMMKDDRARNLFYWGHANDSAIADAVLAQFFRPEFGFKHKYRFVWLDGCDSASGVWRKTLGIHGPGTFAIEYYKERTKRPGAFVGYTNSIPFATPNPVVINGVQYDGRIPQHVGYFLTETMFRWYSLGQNLNTAIAGAKVSCAGLGATGMVYVNGPLKGQPYAMGDSLVIHGFDTLKFNEYNKQGQVPRP